MNNHIPKTKEEAFEQGRNSHVEGLNPFRNRGFEYSELHNAWIDGFNEHKKEQDIK